MGFMYKNRFDSKKKAEPQEIASVKESCRSRKFMSRNDVKKAGITIEMMLAISLAVVVLFLVLGLFSNNLKNMVAGGGMQNIFKSSTTMDSETKLNKNYANSQMEVGVMAGQGVIFDPSKATLPEWIAEAKKQLDALKNKTPLTDADKMIIAKWATILGQTNPSNIYTPLEDYLPLIDNCGIKFGDRDNPNTTEVPGHDPVPWGNGYTSPTPNAGNLKAIFDNSEWSKTN